MQQVTEPRLPLCLLLLQTLGPRLPLPILTAPAHDPAAAAAVPEAAQADRWRLRLGRSYRRYARRQMLSSRRAVPGRQKLVQKANPERLRTRWQRRAQHLTQRPKAPLQLLVLKQARWRTCYPAAAATQQLLSLHACQQLR